MSQRRMQQLEGPDCPALPEEWRPDGATPQANMQEHSTERTQGTDEPHIIPKYGALGLRALLFTPSWFSINM